MPCARHQGAQDTTRRVQDARWRKAQDSVPDTRERKTQHADQGRKRNPSGTPLKIPGGKLKTQQQRLRHAKQVQRSRETRCKGSNC